MSALRLATVLFCLATAATAQVTIPQPFLASLSPVAVKAGSVVEITITGADLDGASALHFSLPGITCTPKLDDEKQPVANRFVVTIPESAGNASCDVRVVARYGISNPRRLVISTLPVLPVPADAVSADKAFKTPLDVILTGAAQKRASSFVRFDAKKGQRVIVGCRALDIDSRMDPVLVARNAKGVKLARLQPDGLLDLTVPEAGVITLELGDLMYRGDVEHPYVMHLSSGPVIQYAFDGGAQWVLYGRNLPGGTDAGRRYDASLQRVQVPADEAKRLLAANQMPVIRFGVENDAPAPAHMPVALKAPAVHHGWFPRHGQARVFNFSAKKGDVFWIEINCASLGIKADPFFVVQKDEAFLAEAADRPALAARSEFDAGWADPSYRFEAKEDGHYRIRVRNHFSNAPPEPFQLTLKPAGGEFDLVALPSAAPKAKTVTTVEVNAAALWRGGVSTMKVFALRRSGSGGAIPLTASHLPPGVQFLGGVIPDGQSIGYAAFHADDKAEPWGGRLKLAASDKPARGATTLFKVGNTARESVLTRRTDEVVLGVVPSEAPALLEPASATVEVAAGGKVDVPLKLTRRGGFNDAVKLTSLGVEGLTADIAANATQGTLTVDTAKLKLGVGERMVLLESLIKFKHRRNEDPKAAPKDLSFLLHSKPITLRVKAPEKKP